MTETLASEICRDLKRQNQIKNVVIAVMALALGGAVAAARCSTHTVATHTGR